MTEKRQFSTWANRDIATWKLEYSNYIHPLNDYSFAEYMKSKQIIWWEYRRGDNWTKWIPYDSLFESLVRHVELLKLLYKWYNILEYKLNWEVGLYIEEDDDVFENIAMAYEQSEHHSDIQYKSIESELNAIRFNWEAMKLQHITKNIIREDVLPTEST